MSKKAHNGYPSMIVAGQIITADVVLGNPGNWTEIGSMQVPVGTAIELGLGNLSGQDNAQGRLYYDIVDALGGPEDGMIRIEARNPNQTKIRILYQGSTIKGRSGDADSRTMQIPFPENGIIIPENWFIKILMDPVVGGDTIQASSCTFLMDCVVYDYS